MVNPKNEGQRGLSEMACLGYMVIPQPIVEVRCTVCGNQSYEVICTPAQVKADLEYLRRFHRRRLRPTKNGSPPPSSLADRANFTQDYSTAIVACMVCGLVYRNPRPPAGAVKQAYEKEHYGYERLAAMFDAHVELSAEGAVSTSLAGGVHCQDRGSGEFRR